MKVELALLQISKKEKEILMVHVSVFSNPTPCLSISAAILRSTNQQ